MYGSQLHRTQLWFAWKQLPLQYQQQPSMMKWKACIVVICLKTTTFAVSATTFDFEVIGNIQLWFAWKQLPLQYQQQQNTWKISAEWVVICLKTTTFAVSATTADGCVYENTGCDLLENNYLCSISNNSQILSSCVLWLWFAWKQLPLQYQQQQNGKVVSINNCCDLLENNYLCSISNNYFQCFMSSRLVVICLKTTTFAVSATTLIDKSSPAKELWFAWKQLPLQYQQQRGCKRKPRWVCCDLLENNYLCSISNNWLSI